MPLAPFTSLVANIMTYLIYPIIRKPISLRRVVRHDGTIHNYSVTKTTIRYDVFTFSRKNCGIVYADQINRLITSFDVNVEDRQVTLQLKRRYE